MTVKRKLKEAFDSSDMQVVVANDRTYVSFPVADGLNAEVQT